MNAETKACQNCKQNFTIKSKDFDFYTKINAPTPTWCSDCRRMRRMSWRNERTLYKRNCDLCKRSIISIYSSEKPFTVYCNECYHGDGWDSLSHGLDIDFNKPFLEQFRELQLKVPRLYAFVSQNINSEYTNGSQQNKNCYLLFVSDHNEDSLYSYGVFNCINTIDCYGCNNCELCYESVDCNKCYRALYSQDCADSQDLYFCNSCVNCQDCVGCTNLRNKQYYIFNKPYSKEDYKKELENLHLETREGIAKIHEECEKTSSKQIKKYIHGLRNVEVNGDYIYNSKNTHLSFDSESLEDSGFINHGHSSMDCYDGYVVVDKCQFSYEIVSAISLNNVKFGYCVWHNSNIQYCDTCENCSDLFGCVGLRKKSYCILNKQYSKEEYEKLVPQILECMKKIPYSTKDGKEYKYGEYFPMEFSPFAYNETVAQEYYPLEEAEVQKMGWIWKKEEKKEYKVTLESGEVPKTISETKDSILNEILECEHKNMCKDGCTTAFKITSAELQLYKKLNVPLPLLCNNCRHTQRLKKRNPLKLWHRKCMKTGCTNEFETSYAPERPEIVYCEQCYQTEVV